MQRLDAAHSRGQDGPHMEGMCYRFDVGNVEKSASGVLALLPCSRTESTLRASKGLRPFLRLCSGQDWIDPSERLSNRDSSQGLKIDLDSMLFGF